ncbi:[FeFe]-hydrogenase maturation radical SAM domain iron-sulfur cluster-binding oxidoreductase HydE [Syntrophotalea carbinolica DSM 2380]|uniref:[FeFe]-hydrogenase maturation radical SAM domain iron-sulfur cluster-binding oxidoreductase HydE n=1 Tax=Syntrophotalea carbinolica (strain DSM 2380 / NBRC 103641 / GraBd1) TaxID=338963 RepID=Q3A3U2_SYNC1|nr:[FeFe] hydrogenase H-cluster radical SAM maturase HydE [Syntrophotalea carbinolica]ABA88965.1 [FeFe]-hydrogenase maturation radical SAM domain iron-sulfur cluster-binding oxidoreductase HydE [Syntrophotalea carbinolica DSM 2380]
MTREEILYWLKNEDERSLTELWDKANDVRHSQVGDAVHLRGLLEFSNHCSRDCHYCGLRAGNSKLTRYRMSEEEIMCCVEEGVAYGYGTLVLQSGEDYGLDVDWMTKLIQRIKRETPLAVTLSLGERSAEDLTAWRDAGADRYLLRFETSDPELYRRIHPALPGHKPNRIELLRIIKKIGYETGSGVMVGIPGQTYEDLAKDIETFRELDLDMIGVGPFIPHHETLLGSDAKTPTLLAENQVPNTELMTYKVMALARLIQPLANIPATSALATLNTPTGRELGLSRGANVVMPNLTPKKYRALYEIYPAKACIDETAADCRSCMHRRIQSIGRQVGKGRGDSPSYRRA